MNNNSRTLQKVESLDCIKEPHLLQASGLFKTFRQGQEVVRVLDDLDFSIQRGEMVALVGPSGAGKSTFLQIMGALERCDRGQILFEGQDVETLGEGKRTLLRRHKLGFVYQFHYLLPEFSALENVCMPLIIAGVRKSEAKEQAADLLDVVGLGHRLRHRPPELSGGEQQRVAIARALVNKPKLLLADEPTGNLDPENAEKIIDLLLDRVKTANVDERTSVLMATHNMELAGKLDRVVELRNGRLC